MVSPPVIAAMAKTGLIRILIKALLQQITLRFRGGDTTIIQVCLLLLGHVQVATVVLYKAALQARILAAIFVMIRRGTSDLSNYL